MFGCRISWLCSPDQLDFICGKSIIIYQQMVYLAVITHNFDTQTKTYRRGLLMMNEPVAQRVVVHDLGRISYQEALAVQRRLMQKLIDVKLSNRHKSEAEKVVPCHYFLFCEHEHVFTLGRTGDEDNLLLNDIQLAEQSIEYYKTNRGGDITYHGPGQVVGYPIFDLDYFFTDVHKYVRYIEEAIIRTLAQFNLVSTRVPDFTGVWLEGDVFHQQRKICAIGIHLSRWVSMHGFALNVNTDLSFFDKIVPCGIPMGDKQVTSMARELDHDLSISKVQARIIENFAVLFGFDFYEADAKTLY